MPAAPGDATGQMTYDMFNLPLSNSLAGTIDPATGKMRARSRSIRAPAPADVNQTGITGTIVTCPKYESDGMTLSPLAGQAVIANLMPGRYGVVATPAADRIARGEEWLQTNTLDGQKAHDSFLRIGEPLLPGVRAGRIPRLHRLCQPEDHQRPPGGRLRRHRSQPHGYQLHELP